MSSISSLTSSSSNSSSSSTSTSNIYNGRIFGLASGLDVDSIVTGLVSDIQSEIDKEGQKKQTLQWKQTDYQSIVTALNAFNSSYLELSGSGSLTAPNALQTYTASSSNSSVVTATAAEGANGAAASITVYQNAATASVRSSASSNQITGSVDLTNASNLTALEGKAFNFTVDGVSKSITLTADDVSSYNGAAGALQHEIDTAFGWSSDSSSVNGERVKVSLDSSSGDVTFAAGSYTDGGGKNVSYNTSFSVSAATDSSGNTVTAGMSALLGTTTAQSNRLNRNESVQDLLKSEGITLSSSTVDLNINGKSISLNATDSLFTALNTINSSDSGVTFSYSSTTGIMSATASDSGAAGNFTLLGSGSDETNTAAFLKGLGFQSSSLYATDSSTGEITTTPLATTNGQDAVFSLDGGTSRMARSSNSFTVDGVAYTITGTVSSSDPQTANITFTQDTSTAVKNIQNFVSAYNTLLATITTYTNTKPDSDYQPLTDSQKSSMSDTAISDWNAKASAGVLFNDDTLNSLEQELRDMVSTSVTTSDGTTISLSSLGIRESTVNTGTDDTTPGQLVFDDGSTDTLVSMLQDHAQEVEDLFTKQSTTAYIVNDPSTVTVNGVTKNVQTVRKNSEGLAYRLSDIIADYTTEGDSGTSSSQGKLISLLGDANDGDKLNSIYDQITDANSQITDYKKKMTDKKNQLYSKFSTLESFMAKMNSQSGLLSSLSSGS